jgi:pimeloyl-ACP methyl ester carboxylesterase
MRLRHEASAVAQALTALGSGGMPRLSSRVPTCFVAGERDERYVALADRSVPGVGHNVVLEAPEALAPLLDRQLHDWSESNLEIHP